MTEKVNEQLKQELAKLGDPMIIAGCPSCMKQLKESIGAHVIGIWEILKKSDFHSRRKGLEIPVAIHDACGARGCTDTRYDTTTFCRIWDVQLKIQNIPEICLPAADTAD